MAEIQGGFERADAMGKPGVGQRLEEEIPETARARLRQSPRLSTDEILQDDGEGNRALVAGPTFQAREPFLVRFQVVFGQAEAQVADEGGFAGAGVTFEHETGMAGDRLGSGERTDDHLKTFAGAEILEHDLT